MSNQHSRVDEWNRNIRPKIVAALNHHELVPPQADDETTLTVELAWAALYDGWLIIRNLEEQVQALETQLAGAEGGWEAANSLKEQLEAAHANMDRYGMALAEIAEGFSRTSLNAHEAILIARGALNPAKKPT